METFGATWLSQWATWHNVILACEKGVRQSWHRPHPPGLSLCQGVPESSLTKPPRRDTMLPIYSVENFRPAEFPSFLEADFVNNVSWNVTLRYDSRRGCKFLLRNTWKIFSLLIYLRFLHIFQIIILSNSFLILGIVRLINLLHKTHNNSSNFNQCTIFTNFNQWLWVLIIKLHF